MSDLISREDVYDVLKKVSIREMPIYVFDKLWNGIRELPSAEPERKWIPVTEALPENDDWVIVSIYDDDGDTSWQYTTPGFYVPYGKCWIVDNEYCKNIIAWMPLPEPWRGNQ